MTENDIFKAIQEVVSDRTDKNEEEITKDCSFRDLGIDSLDTVELLMELEDKLDMTIELDKKIDTVGDLVSFILSKAN